MAGAAVVVDVHTGFILAMLSRPGFDPNLLTGRVTPAEMLALSKDPLQPMIFRPVAQHYSPGSTFKPFTQLAAFKSGLVHAADGGVLQRRLYLGSSPLALRQGDRPRFAHRAPGAPDVVRHLLLPRG